MRAIKNEAGYSQFFYRDALLQGSYNVLQILIELVQLPALEVQVLDILGARSWGGDMSFLKRYLSLKDPRTYILALKVLARNPIQDSYPYFEEALSSKNPEVRCLGIEGMSLFPSDQLCNILENGLKDDEWMVRVAAGKALKQQGDQGIEILNRQPEGKEKEAAQFVLNFE